ncbi:hypothetical protein BGX30_004392 [Mortierella sp. GBA39]|nr:hypothetical protein BGX30_004392 [Mortierella sp. GBA39]
MATSEKVLFAFIAIAAALAIFILEMSALLSSAKANESRAGGFSLVRLLTKNSSSGGTSSKPLAYQFSHSRSGKDPSLPKTPSTHSSNYDYDWDLSDFSKERTKDGFPVITLTSPTSSEVSIPFISLDEQPASTSSSSGLYPTNPESRKSFRRRKRQRTNQLNLGPCTTITTTVHTRAHVTPSIVVAQHSSFREARTSTTDYVSIDGRLPANV